jgi:IclR family pca regulon transcriptional regulator
MPGPETESMRGGRRRARKPSAGSTKNGGSYVQSLEKGLRVLEAFTANETSLSIARAAEISGIDRAGARRLLLTLKQLGYLSVEGRSFSLTPRVLLLSQQYLEGLPFWQLAQSVMQELSATLNETISIGVLDQTDVVYVLRVPARRILAHNPNIGSRITAYLWSIGHVLLSSFSDDELHRYLQQLQLRAYTAHTIRNASELRRKILETRKTGWSFVRQQYEMNACGIAVAIKDARGRAIAALNVSQIVSDQVERNAVDHILPMLRVAAEKLSGPR